jgi:hypothetical protein
MLEEHILKLFKDTYHFNYNTHHIKDNPRVLVTYQLEHIQGCLTMSTAKHPSGLTLVSIRFADDIEHICLMNSAHHTLARLIKGYA